MEIVAVIVIVIFVEWAVRKILTIRKHTSISLVFEQSFHNFKITGNVMANKIPVKDYAKTAFKIKNNVTGEILDPAKNLVTFANEAFTGFDPAIANVVVDAGDTPDDAILDVQGIGVGETDITFDVDASYIDPAVLADAQAADPNVDINTLPKVTKHLQASVHVTVAAGDTDTSLVVDLGEPQPMQ